LRKIFESPKRISDWQHTQGGMPKKEDSSLSQKDPQPGGQQILMDISFVIKLLKYRLRVFSQFSSLLSIHNLLLRAICQFLEVS